MPEIRPTFSEIGRGFAAYLAPPSPDVIRLLLVNRISIHLNLLFNQWMHSIKERLLTPVLKEVFRFASQYRSI